MSTIKSTRQFTKRRPQSPLVQQQQLPGAATPTGTPPLVASSIAPVAVQSSRAPLRASRTEIPHEHEKRPTEHQQEENNHVHDHLDHSHGHEHVHNQHLYQPPSSHLPHDHDHNNNTLGYIAHPHDHAHAHNHAHSHDPDHHGHDHSNHSHNHPHIHDHKHDHGHNHDHDHDHDHGHHHHHYPDVYVPPLPSWSGIFSNLAPMQKTIFTWFLIHSMVGSLVWWAGTSRDSACMIGFSYLVIFDALGVLNIFISDIVRTNPAFLAINTKRPFAARRYEIVFAMATTVYLLFVTMYTTKESLEHLLMEKGNASTEDHHHEAHLGFGGFIIMCIAMTATVLSSVSLRNHENFVRYLRRSPPTVHGYSYNVLNRARGNAVKIVLSNIYSFSIVSCGLAVVFLYMFGMASPFMDKLTAFGESAVMLYLGGPTAAALAKLLLQTTPDGVRSGIESRLLEIRQNPNVIAIDRVHFWQNTYGKCVGTLEIQVKPDTDEQSLLQFVYQKLEGLTSVDTTELDGGHSGSELTVSIIKQ
ncbi:hypothetical protein INT45_002861 [Circinella minor]|uniref:Cation efflux family-domain-containing protein n=1 Tax=Circinella minor TaxID=1195481 RepID=A0A8H7S856_9FUNG|nr:hypothetical protein INT45_002861 [Circinella minor]